jgi:hypothetical protein
MKKQILVAAMAAFAVAAEPAFADCSGTALNQSQLEAALPGKTVCGRPGAAYPAASGGATSSDRWQEQHVGSGTRGDLVDFKQGPGDPVDPSKSVGTWAIIGGQVTHNYGAGASYTYTVYQAGSVYSFCEGSSERARATVKAGLTSCGSDYPD